MKSVVLTLSIILALSVQAEEKLIRSVSGAIYKISSDSDLKDNEQKQVLTFSPNVASGLGVSLETPYLSLAYFFAGKHADDRQFPKSQFRDFRINFNLEHLDFRLNFQRYKGAIVNAANVKHYYSDYEVEGKNLRIHYYRHKHVLKYVRDGADLTSKTADNQGKNYFGSWFVGLNVDRRVITLPNELVSAHLRLVNDHGINYSRYLNTLTIGPLAGYDHFIFWENFYFRIKLAGGPGFQIGGNIVQMIEIAANAGVAFFKRHSLGISVDAYTMSFKDNGQAISNNNTQAGVVYNYSF